MIEEWRDVPGYPGYRASSLGRISGPTGRIIGTKDRCGYVRISICRAEVKKMVSAHSMVALAFLGPRPDGCDIDHIDHSRENNAPHNLRYCSHAENMARRALPPPAPKRAPTGRSPGRVGEKNANARLTEKQALEILSIPLPPQPRRRCDGLGNSYRDLAARYGVEKTAISDLLAGKSWKHLKRPHAAAEASGDTKGGAK